MLGRLLRAPLAPVVRRLWPDFDRIGEFRDSLRTLREEAKALRQDARARGARLAFVEAQLETSRASLLRALDVAQHDAVAQLSEVLDDSLIAAHVTRAIQAAPLLTDPCDHLVVEGVVPDDVYDLLLEAIPPDLFFDDRDPIKRNIVFPSTSVPLLTQQVWNFMDAVIAGKLIRTAAVERFQEPLQRHFDTVFGPATRERANTLSLRPDGGRLMLRGPGYIIRPHRDPKRSLLTCLMYLARPGDSEVYGTQIYRVEGDPESRYKQTYYPEGDGLACELVRTVPFKRNSMVVFLNSRGAHGVLIPKDAPADLKRYSYQFYVAPEKHALAALLKSVPKERRAMWQNKEVPESWLRKKTRGSTDGEE